MKPDLIPETTAGGIALPETVLEQHGNAQVAGILVAHGPDAWSDYEEPFAEDGDRVMFAKWNGNQIIGKDGELYRVMNDRDITARIEEGVAFNDIQSRRAVQEGS